MSFVTTRWWTIWVVVVAVLTLGIWRLDHPRKPRLPNIGPVHRWVLALEARRRGRQDGRLGIPGAEEKIAPPEVQKLKQQADGVLRRIAAAWSDGDARLKGEYHAILREQDAAAAAIAATERDLEATKSKCNAIRVRLSSQQQDDALRSADERWRLPSSFYLPAIVIIFIGEFPLNAVAFQLFQEDLLMTWAMTAGLAATLVLCAHALGIFLQMKPSSARSELLSWVLGVLPVAVIVAIAIIRETYIQQSEAASETTQGLSQLGPVLGTVVFAVMNLIIFVGAGVLSYLHHDPHGAMIERTQHELRKTEKRVKSLRAQLKSLTARRRWLDGKREVWRAGREGVLRAATYQALRHKDFYESFIQLYWSSNRRRVQNRIRRQLRRWRRYERRALRRHETVPERPVDWRAPRAMTAEPPVRIPPVFDNTHVDHLLSWDFDDDQVVSSNGSFPDVLTTRAPV